MNRFYTGDMVICCCVVNPRTIGIQVGETYIIRDVYHGSNGACSLEGISGKWSNEQFKLDEKYYRKEKIEKLGLNE